MLAERKKELAFTQSQKRNMLKGAGFFTATGYREAVKSGKKIEGRQVYVKKSVREINALLLQCNL
jgi:hypothetical protein